MTYKVALRFHFSFLLLESFRKFSSEMMIGVEMIRKEINYFQFLKLLFFQLRLENVQIKLHAQSKKQILSEENMYLFIA